jgi:hypothetical protein
MMETVRTSETSVNFNVTTRRYIPEDSKLHIFWYFVLSKKTGYFKSVPLLAMQALRGEEYSSYSFLISALDGGECSASAPATL